MTDLLIMIFSAPGKVLQYMLDQNRPYSAGVAAILLVTEFDVTYRALLVYICVGDIFNNLHKEFGKTVSKLPHRLWLLGLCL